MALPFAPRQSFGPSLLAVALAGCVPAKLPATAALSDTEDVPVGDGAALATPLGRGAQSLTDSTWAVYRVSDDVQLFRIRFGPDGEVQRLTESVVFASPWLGDVIEADTRSHPTAFAGGSYVAGAYAAEQDGNVGVLGVIHGIFLGTHVGTATLSLYGPVAGDRIDGPMARTVETFADTPFPAPDDAEFDAYALREQSVVED